ncbi:hypothetical protein HaLaN_05157, partial [Haematococcus lacustris]
MGQQAGSRGRCKGLRAAAPPFVGAGAAASPAHPIVQAAAAASPAGLHDLHGLHGAHGEQGDVDMADSWQVAAQPEEAVVGSGGQGNLPDTPAPEPHSGDSSTPCPMLHGNRMEAASETSAPSLLSGLA